MIALRRGRLDEPAALALVDEVQRYYVELYGGPDDDPLAADDFAPPTGGFFLGLAGEDAVAMGGWTFVATDRTRAKIRRVYVRPAFRGTGAAGAVLAAIEADARSAGATRAVLTTGTPQVAAVRFYRAHAYTDIEPFGYYAAESGAVHLGKTLAPIQPVSGAD